MPRREVGKVFVTRMAPGSVNPHFALVSLVLVKESVKISRKYFCFENRKLN
jgi:hypothetical protein